MSGSVTNEAGPPKLRPDGAGGIEPGSVADLVEWFLNYDERTARMRHSNTEELFQWKQADDSANGIATYPFENAEARFAIGVFQALRENNSEPLLALWLNDVIAALHEARETRSSVGENNEKDPMKTSLQKAELLTTSVEKRIYLSSCWHEALFTAEARVLGWVYQELYGRPFTPSST